jgi:hypothetical protein
MVVDRAANATPWWGQGAAGMKHKDYVTCASKMSPIKVQENWTS